MRHTKTVLTLLLCCGLLLAGFSSASHSQSTPLPPTLTRVGEVAIPFKMIAANPSSEVQANGEASYGSFAPPLDTASWNNFIVAGPRVFLLTTPAEANAVSPWLAAAARALLAARSAADYADSVVLLVILGVSSSCCSDSDIQRIAATDEGSILVYTLLHSANMGTADIITAYEMVEIQRSDLPQGFSAQTEFGVLRSEQSSAY